MLRELRTLSDIEGEFNMALANRALAAELETVIQIASEGCSHISSPLVKQVALLGTDSQSEPLEQFVPPLVIDALRAKLAIRKLPAKS